MKDLRRKPVLTINHRIGMYACFTEYFRHIIPYYVIELPMKDFIAALQ
jgi:hypothetical protein